MDHRNLFGIAAILLSASVFLHTLNSADASMPVGMQYGQFPYEHFTECDLPGASIAAQNEYCSYTYSYNMNHTLLTVPNDRIFVVTGATTQSYGCTFLSDGVPLIAVNLIRGYESRASASPLAAGNAHLVLAAGSTLDINIRSSNCPFYLEGYYAHL